MSTGDANLDDIIARLSNLEGKLEALKPSAPSTLSALGSIIATILSSGFFFLLVGAGLLFLAQAQMATNHAGFTFILVVLGVALFLYGTGTQGSGKFEPNVGYNIAIAGGAGVVAFAVAYGIIRYSPEMRSAFQPEKKFVRVMIQGGDGMTDITQYVSTFEMDGSPVPSVRKGRNVEVYIPYMPFELARFDETAVSSEVEAQTDDEGTCRTAEDRSAAKRLDHGAPSKIITASFYRIGTNLGGSRATAPEQKFLVRMDPKIFRTNDGGMEYPSYPVRLCVTLQPADATNVLLNAARRERSEPLNHYLKTDLPPALVEAQ